MARPTDDARFFFAQAEKEIAHGGTLLSGIAAVAGQPDTKRQSELELARGLWSLAKGLTALSVGLRATYMELEEVKSLVERTKPDSRWR